MEICFRLIDAFHPILGQQTKSVVAICDQVASSNLLAAREREVLRVSSWLYNLGRIGLPRDLLSRALNNPQDLSEQEQTLMRHYPVYGQTLATFVENLDEVGQTIRSHRERFDGQGYPDQLSRESIPVPARHLAVAVGFAALIHAFVVSDFSIANVAANSHSGKPLPATPIRTSSPPRTGGSSCSRTRC